MLTLATAETQRAPAYPARAVMSALPVICFAGALATDLAYWRTSEIQWANFSAWLLAIGMALGVLSVFFELVHLFRMPRARSAASGWWRIGVIAIALVVALANNFVHGRDGWTSVVPSGLILSAVTVALLIAASFMGAHSANRDRIGNSP
jgi:uncharacterized membrane protein